MNIRTALVIFMLFSANMVFAAMDVAMVVSGTATAKLAQDTWKVQIAEMLPENVVLTVAADSLLKLMHLANNKEYEIPASATVKVTRESIEGTDIEGKTINIATGKMLVDASMQQQTGAAYGDRHILMREKKKNSDYGNNARMMDKGIKIEDLGFDDKTGNEPAGGDSIIQTPSGNESIIDPTPASTQSSGFPPIQSDGLHEDEANEREIQLPKSVFFAVPLEMYESFAKPGADFTFSNEHQASILSIEKKNGWVYFTCESPQNDIDVFEGNFLTSSGKYVVALLNQPDLECRFSVAMDLEKQGRFCQAAAIWLKLGEKFALGEEVLNLHLNRLKKKITGN
jgi:hypothetical protein